MGKKLKLWERKEIHYDQKATYLEVDLCDLCVLCGKNNFDEKKLIWEYHAHAFIYT